MAGLTWKPQTNNSQTAAVTSSDTSEIDSIIAQIVNLKAQPQSASRDAKIQDLTAKRNYLIAKSNDKTLWY